MKNKIVYLVFLFALFFTFSNSINALDCEYSDGKLTAKFTITESNGKVSSATINGELNSTDETNIINQIQGIENWNSVFKPAGDSTVINSKGIDYYNGYKACPPYTIFVDRLGQFDFMVTTESHLEEFKEYGKKKQGYAIMPLTEGGGGGDAPHSTGGSCASYTNETDCKNSTKFACVWNETKYGNYCNTDNLTYVTCGDSFDIPSSLPPLISFLVNLLKIVTPIILIVVSMVTLLKALAASKEDEINKAKNSLIKKVIAAVLIFFVVSIVQLVISIVADDSEAESISACLSCFLNNDCETNIYYKTNVAGTYTCTYLNGPKTTFTCKGNK